MCKMNQNYQQKIFILITVVNFIKNVLTVYESGPPSTGRIFLTIVVSFFYHFYTTFDEISNSTAFFYEF